MAYQVDPGDKKVMCVYLARGDESTAKALYDISWQMTTSGKGHELLEACHKAYFPAFSLELYAEEQTIAECYVTSGPAQLTLGKFLNTINPYIQIKEIPDYLENLSDEGMFAVGNINYGNWDIYPAEDYKPVAVAPMQNVLQAVAQVPPKFKVVCQLCVMPIHTSVRLHGYLWFWRQIDKVRHYLIPKYWFKQGVRKTQVAGIIDKTKRKWTISNLRIAVILEGPEGANGGRALEKEMRGYLEQILVGYSMMNLLDVNWYIFHSVKFGKKHLKDMIERRIGYWRPAVLITLQELAGWWTIPGFGGLNFRKVLSRHFAPPLELPSPETEEDRSALSVFGKTIFRNQEMAFGILREDRNRHMLVVGAARTGKSKLLSLLIQEDLNFGHGCGVIDPTGMLIDEILQLIPPQRIDDVLIFDPSDTEFPASLNPFELVDDQSRMRVASGLLEMFKVRFSKQWSDRLEHLLLNTILALLSAQWTTVLSIKRMLLEDNYRSDAISNIKDLVVREFWQNKFPYWKEYYKESVIEPILKMVGNFVANEMIRNTLGQPFNKFDFRQIIDSGKILLMKIMRRDLGEDNAALLGAMIVTRIYQAAISRADIPFEERRDFYLYIDSFDEFATSSFEEILSESRKYKLNLTVSNQNLNLLLPSVRNSLFGNVGSMVAFRMSTEDAPVLARELMPKIETVDLTSLPPQHFYAKMSVHSRTQRVFSGRTLEFQIPEENFAEECVQASRSKYAIPKAQATEIIDSWSKVG